MVYFLSKTVRISKSFKMVFLCCLTVFGKEKYESSCVRMFNKELHLLAKDERHGDPQGW